MNSLSKIRPLILVLLFAICQLLPGIDVQQAKEEIKEIKLRIQSWGLSDEYEIASERALEDVILFIKDPENRLDSIKYLDAAQLWTYIAIYNDVMMGKPGEGSFYFFYRLAEVTESMNDKKVILVTYLLHDRRPDGVYAELMTGQYTRLFGDNPGLFVNDLRKRQDWKGIIDGLASGDYLAMNAGVAELGDSSFEKELKKYWAECLKRWYH